MTQSRLIVQTELCAASAVAACCETHSWWGLHMQILKEDDASWPPPDKAGRQELEIILGEAHISFTTTKLGSLMQVQQSKDPDGLRIFYYLVQVSSMVATGFTFACVYLTIPLSVPQVHTGSPSFLPRILPIPCNALVTLPFVTLLTCCSCTSNSFVPC